jgi:hypothetical protein
VLERRWVQAGGAAGIAGLPVGAASFPLNGGSPDSNASTAQIASYFVQQRDAVFAGQVFLVAASALFLWYGGTLSHLIHERDTGSPLGLILLMATAVMVGRVFAARWLG